MVRFLGGPYDGREFPATGGASLVAIGVNDGRPSTEDATYRLREVAGLAFYCMGDALAVPWDLLAMYPNDTRWTRVDDVRWTSVPPAGVFQSELTRFHLLGARHQVACLVTDRLRQATLVDTDAHVWHRLHKQLEYAECPPCEVPDCDGRGMCVLIAAGHGRFAGATRYPGDEIRICGPHLYDLRRYTGSVLLPPNGETRYRRSFLTAAEEAAMPGWMRGGRIPLTEPSRVDG